MDFGNGWQLTRDQRLKLYVLDWLYDHVKGQAEQYVRLNAKRLISLAPNPSPKPATLRAVVENLSQDRLLSYTVMRDAEVREIPSEACLTREGIEAVECLRRRREDPAARRPATRDALLRWAYDRNAAGEARVSPINFGLGDYGRFLSAQLSYFSVTEVEVAINWLEKAGYITTARGPRGSVLTFAITEAGERLVESGRSTSENEQPVGTTSFTITNSTGVNITNQSSHVTQTSTVTLTKEGQQAIGNIADYLERAADLLELPVQERERLPEIVSNLRSAAVEPTVDHHRLRALLDTVKQLAIGAAASGPLALGLDALVQQALHLLGW